MRRPHLGYNGAMRSSFILLAFVAFVAFWSVGARAAGYTPAPCMVPDGADGLPKALTAPTLLGEKTIAPGASFTAGPLRIKLTKTVMPAYVGTTQGEAVVDGDVQIVDAVKKDGESSKNSASSHLPATIRLDRYRVVFDEAGATGGAQFAVRVDDLGCVGEQEGFPMTKGETMTLWLSTDGAPSVELFAGDDRETSAFSSDVFQLGLTSGTSENSNRRVVMDDKGRPLIPGWITLRSWENGPESKEITAVALNTKGAQLAMKKHKIEVLKVVHGPKTKLRFKEPYAPADPALSVLVKITRTN